MFATNYTSKVTITLYDGHYFPTLTIGESSDAEFAGGVLVNGFYAPVQDLDAAPLAAYAYYGNEAYENLILDEFENVPLGIKTSDASSYKLFFADLQGDIRIYDKVTGSEIDLTHSYSFTATANSTINDRFVINYVAPAPVYAAEVTTNAFGLATFSFNQDVEAVETEVKLYKGAVSGDELALTSVDYVKAGQGVVVYGAANTTYHFNVGNGGTSSFDGNDLLPASAWDLAAQDGYDIYVLSGNMLYLYEGTTMKPNKAFLKLNQNPLAGNAPARIRMVFNSATGVENVEAEAVKAEKFIENGQIFIRRGEAVYNLQGQIVK